MPIDNTTNLNISNPSDILGNQDVDRASASTKTVELNPVNNSRGITEVSATDDFITTFSGTPKPSLRQPEIPLGQLIDQTVTLAPEVAKMLNLSTQPTLGEFITSCTGKLTDDIGKIALDDKAREAGGDPGKFDSEILDCMIALLTMDSKSNLIQTFRDTLQAKIKDRKAINQRLIDKNVEIANKNAEAIKQQEEVQAKAKLWGILGAVFSAIVAVVSAALTVATFGAATPLAAAVATLAICGCAMTVGGSVCTIVGLAADNETLQKIGMGLGIAGGVFSLASGIGSIWVAAEHAANVLKVINIVTSAVSGVTSSVGQIVNGIAQEDLAETEKELATMKIDLAKLDNQIELLSGMIDKIAKGIQDFMKDLFQDEEEVSQMIRQMMQTSLDIGQNVKC